MAIDNLVTAQVFGAERKPTVYFMTGYENTIAKHWLPIRMLRILGHRVVAFEYEPEVLCGGDPKYLPEAVDAVVEQVNEDKLTHKVAGVYGVSLGSLFAYNVLKQPGIDKAIFNTGGVSMAKTLWTAPRLAGEKAAMIHSGFGYEDIKDAWDSYDVGPEADGLEHKKLLVMDSVSDPVISYEDAKAHVQSWQEQGIDARILTTHGLNHGHTIARNFFRILKTATFFG
jgi:predicted esterase YcpF (UPF0227 family)